MYHVEQTKKRTFEFEVGGVEYSVPSLSQLPLDTVKEYAEAIKSGDDLTFVLWILGNVFPADAAEAVGKLPIDQVSGLIHAYIAESREAVGESRA